MAKQFTGSINLDIRDSTPDWDAFLPDRAPQGAPNVLVVLYDDTGCAAWSPYGGRINMPTMQRLADNGLTYSQWHTTALCSPTRSVFLTGRNHHQNGFASISETSTGFPGYNSHIPRENATMATVLRNAGWSTFWVGKDHNTPVDAWTMGSSKKDWPLGLGYDRFYGFIGGETNQWYPDLAEDNHYIEQPYGPEDGWAVAFSTPFRMFKRYSYQGGVADPLVVHWPAGISARGEVRSQYHHCTDIVPTILECCGVEMPEVVDGYQQTPLPGVSMRYSFDAADAPTTKQTQYYEMLGTRGIWHQGWKAVTEHGPVPIGRGRFDQDRWQLFHTDEDRAEAHDLADQHPGKLEELKALWREEARKYDVLPLNDLSIFEFRALEYTVAVPASGQYTYYPGTSEVPEASAANTINVSYKILAEVEFTGDSQGVIFAQGSRFGGYSLFVKDGKLVYVYNFLGIPPEQRLVADAPASGTHVVGVEFTKERAGEHHEPYGPLKLHVDDQVVAEAEMRTIASRYSLCGEGLCIGYDGGDAVSSDYKPRFAFTGGRIVKVVYDVGDAYVDLERHLHAAMARD
jgi:arylsulfatase A-like enzyme